MKEFDKWWIDKENCGMNKNNKPPIQFTKLTYDDKVKHRESYIALLWDDRGLTLSEKGEELHKAMQLFYDEFK